MSIRTKNFVQITSLLTLLIVTVCTSMSVFAVRNHRQGDVLYDIATAWDQKETVLHIGLSPNEMDRQAQGGVLMIGTLGVATVLIGALLAAGIAGISTRKVNKMTKALGASREKLRKQNQFLNNVLGALTHPFYVIDAKDYTIKLANSAVRIGNLSDDSTCYALTHKRDKPCGSKEHLCTLEEVKKTKKPVIIEHIHYDKDENPRNVEVHGYPIFDSDGNVSEMIEYCLDITKRKKAEESLKKALDQWETTFNAAKDSIMLIDSEFKIIQANLATSHLLGIPLNDILGKSCYRLVHKTDVTPEICPLKIGKQTRKHEEAEFHIPEKDVWIMASADPIFDSEGNISGVIHIIRDVTERKKAEEALEKLNKDLESSIQELSQSNKELQEFAHITAHDLKTPLRAIGTLTDWLATDYSDKFDQRGKERVNLLVGRAKRIDKLIDSILQYSEVGRIGQKKQEVDLNLVLSKVIREIEPPENIEITIKNELPTIICSEKRMVQVFQNLLSNAVRYMNKPKGQIKVGCSEENGFWKFSVSDNGPGIEQKYFEKIFKIFQTLSTRDEVEAIGMGLSLTKKIVELYGGRIWVQSKTGQGSTFFFTLPKQEMGVENEKLRANIAC